MSQKSNLNIDKFWQRTVIKILPNWITPNLLSLLRLALVPFIFWLVWQRHYPLGLLLFVLTVLTDSLDGAIARYRNQITPLGLILDPLADKLLIAGVSLLLLFRYPFPELIFYLIFFEVAVIVVGYFWIKILKRPAIPSNSYGKLKMVCQSLGLTLIFIWLITLAPIWLYFSAITLLLALLFVILSAIHPLK